MSGNELGSEDRPSNRFGLAFLRLVRLYTRNFPIDKGKSRLMLAALKLTNERPRGFIHTLNDGRRLCIDLSTGMQERVFFFDQYEPFVTELVRNIVADGDVCIDAGANFGWYTTLMAGLVGKTGTVHAFEPVPSTFRELRANIDLVEIPHRVIANQLALSDSESEAAINLFDGEPTGHASLANKSTSSRSFSCRTIRLDEYLAEMSIAKVDFVKVDVEGAELALLKGSEEMLAPDRSPTIIMEMSVGQSRHFGYVPNDLLDFLRERGNYRFLRIEEERRRLTPIDVIEDDDPGANVLCVPAKAAERVEKVVGRYLCS